MRILVVEDQDSIRRMIEALVQARGYDVTARLHQSSIMRRIES